MDPFAGNLAALETRSPDVASRVAQLADLGAFSIAETGGQRLVELGGRALESRRDPAGVARRHAHAITDHGVVVLGLGTGFLADALLETGHEVAAIIESGPQAIAAAMHARDLRTTLSRVPVVLMDAQPTRAEFAALRSVAPTLVPLGARVALDPGLQDLLARWPLIGRVTRPPRVLVVGPIEGGSLETARSTARAAQAIGADTRLLDFSAFADGWRAMGRLPLSASRKTTLEAGYATLLGEATLAFASEWQPDLVLALAQAPMPADVLAALRARGVATAMWFVENGRVLRYWQDVAADYDVFFTIQPEPFLASVRAAGASKAVCLPTACDRTRHVPVTLTPDERAAYGADISFAGAPYLNRQRLLLGLLDLNPRLWGEGWADTELARCAANEGRRFTLAEMVKVFAATAINLNVHSANHVEGLDPDPDYVNPRTFELAACEAFQLVDARAPLPFLFKDDEMVTFRSVSELRDLIRHYLAHPEERHAIARRSRARALAQHTFEHRVRRILHETLPAELASPAPRASAPLALNDSLAQLARHSDQMTGDEAMLRVLSRIQAGQL